MPAAGQNLAFLFNLPLQGLQEASFCKSMQNGGKKKHLGAAGLLQTFAENDIKGKHKKHGKS